MMKSYIVFAIVLMFGLRAAQAGLDMPVQESLEVMQKNAAAGNALSQFNLAVSYERGRNAPKDPARAVEWYRKAAAGGVPEAQYNLGVLLINGVEAPRDPKEAARWFYAAAQNGFFEAQKMLMRAYIKGEGVEKSPGLALAWDFLARRTLELRYGMAAGVAPMPIPLKANGTADAGRMGKEWSLAGGIQPRIVAGGARSIDYRNGSWITVQDDGGWEIRYPNDFRKKTLSEQITAEGRRTSRDQNGGVEITEPDGSRVVEADGTDQAGLKVRIRDSFGPDGKRLKHCVVQNETTYEERADGTRVLETRAKRDDGVDVILTEKVSESGKASDGRLRRADSGEGPKGAETWEIRRKLRMGGGEVAMAIERYTETGLSFQKVLQRMIEVPPRIAGSTAPGQVAMNPSRPIQVMFPPQVVSMVMPGVSRDDPTAFAPKPDLAPMLREIEEIELEARDFAGATIADYQRGHAGAGAYIIPLPVAPPQKAVNTPAWLRERTITQTTLHEFSLVPILDDKSKVIPFGAHGAEIIKSYPWKHAETDHFIVHYTGESEARLTVQYIEGAYTVLTQLLNLDPQRGPAKSHVFVFSAGEWKGYLAAKSLSPQLAGFAYKTELLLGAATDRQDRAESIKVLCHEVTHALVARFYGARRPPLWLSEGLSEYIALRTMRSKGLLTASNSQGEKTAGSLAKTRDELARLTGKPDATIDVERLFMRIRYGSSTSPDRLAAFYANSQKCLQTLFEKLPPEGFAKFFNTIVAGNGADAALAAAYGRQCDSVAAFQRIVNGNGS
jgi:hypothetical protein